MRTAIAGLLLLLGTTNALGQEESLPEPLDDETFKDYVESGERIGVELLYQQETRRATDHNTPEEERSEEDFYLPDFFSDLDATGAEAFREQLEQISDNPTNLGVIADEAVKQLEDGTSTQAKAYQTIVAGSENEERRSYDPDDELFSIARRVAEEDEALYEDLFGDCETTTEFESRTGREFFSDVRTCNALWLGDVSACTAERRVVFQPLETRTIATIQAIGVPEQCILEGQIAYEACTTRSCEDDLSTLSRDACEFRCLTLPLLEQGECLSQCDASVTESVAACSALEAAQRCGELFQPAFDACAVGLGADPDSLPERLREICTRAADEAVVSCETSCDEEREAAENACSGGVGVAGAPFSGNHSFSIAAFGTPGSYEEIAPDGTRFTIDLAPFDQPIFNADGNEVLHFSANPSVRVDSGQGSLTTWGEAGDGFEMGLTVLANSATRIDVTATLFRVVENGFTGCGEYMDTVADGFCQGELQCISDFGTRTVLSGVEFSTTGPSSSLMSVLRPWHSTRARWGTLEELAPRSCISVASTPLDCNFHLGEWGSYPSLEGGSPVVVGQALGLQPSFFGRPWVDDCAAVSTAPGCTFRGSGDCAEEAQGTYTGRCYVRDVTYQCGDYVPTQAVTERRETTTCQGPIRCVGDQCTRVVDETNTDYAKVATSAMTLQFTDMDMECKKDADGNLFGGRCQPEVYAGEQLTCKIPIGADANITPNCCQLGVEASKQVGLSPGEYMQVQHGVAMINDHPVGAFSQALDRLPGTTQPSDPAGKGDSSKLFYAVAPGSVSDGTRADAYVAREFTSAYQSFAWAFGQEFESASQYESSRGAAVRSQGASLRPYMSGAVGNHLRRIGHPDLAARLTVGGKSVFGGTGTKGEAIGSFTEGYFDYNAAQSVARFAFECEAEEANLGALRAARSCHYVGKYCDSRVLGQCIVTKESYCCYDTALSRIVTEQYREIEGISWGSPKAPNCAGIPADEVGDLPWDRIDLGEWYGLINESRMIVQPNPESVARFVDGATTPKRAIAGQSEVVATGSAGAKSSAEIALDAIDRQAEFIDQTNAALYTAEVQRHDQATMPWWSRTAVDPDDQRPTEDGPVIDLGAGPRDCSAGIPAGLAISPLYSSIPVPSVGFLSDRLYYFPETQYLALSFSAPTDVVFLVADAYNNNRLGSTLTISECPGQIDPAIARPGCSGDRIVRVGPPGSGASCIYPPRTPLFVNYVAAPPPDYEQSCADEGVCLALIEALD